MLPFGPGMPGRPREHALDEESFTGLRALLPAAWTLEPVRWDYGLDARVEVFQGGYATGLALSAQLKATDEAAVKRALGVRFVAFGVLLPWLGVAGLMAAGVLVPVRLMRRRAAGAAPMPPAPPQG